MPLNTSGAIAIGGSTSGQSINLELGRSATTSSNLNETALRTLAGIASGQIALNNFYGKSNLQPVSWTMLIMGGGGGGIELALNSYVAGGPSSPFPASIDDDLWTLPAVSDDDFVPSPNVSSWKGCGGGGGGGLVTTTGTNTGGSLFITVGAGGSGTSVGGSSSYATTSGGVAVVSASGGGSGAYAGTKNGASGGGRTSNWSAVLDTAGTGIAGQGNAGGSTTTSNNSGGGGGKNAGGGAPPSSASPHPGGTGGTGYDLVNFRGGSSAIVAYGGGGGGNGRLSSSNLSNDGANGSTTYTTYTPPANTGGGIRGCTWYSAPLNQANRSRTGGSGRVIVRYAGTTAKATGGNSTYTATVGGTAYYFHEFTASGTITFT